MDPAYKLNIEGLAAVAISGTEQGHPDDVVMRAVEGFARSLGIGTADDFVLVAEAIRAFPQPEDVPAESRVKMSPIEKMLGLKSPEEQLSAQLRAMELVRRLATR